MNSKRSYVIGIGTLVLAALIWGTAFVMQSEAMDDIGPFTFTALRSLLGGAVLLPIYILSSKGEAKKPFLAENRKRTIKAGIICGCILYFSLNFQQVGLVNASAGKGAFITALYIIFVPLVGCFYGKFPNKAVWLGAVMAVVGFYLLNITAGEGFKLGIWEILILFCAIVFTFHIIAVERFGGELNAALLSCMQFLVAGVLSLLTSFLDTVWLGYSYVTLADIGAVWMNIVYLGVFSSGIAYTLQIAGQKRISSATASLIMSLESVFAALAAWIILGDSLELQQLAGCIIS